MDTPHATPQTSHSALPNPHSELLCAARKADGDPCRARPIPGSDYCPFHHPDHTHSFAEGRSQGGAAPRRRVRRLPVILDHLHVAEFLSELMVEVMNSPDGADLRRLQALTQAARVHLKAVGAPRGCFFFHFDRRETPAHLPHLRRYAPPTPDPDLASDPADPPHPSDPPTSAGEIGPSDRPVAHEELLGPALRTMTLYPKEEAARQPIYWLEPDSSVDAEPWNWTTARLAAAAPAEGAAPAPHEPEPPAREDSAAPADRTRLSPSLAAGCEPAPPGTESLGSMSPPSPEPCPDPASTATGQVHEPPAEQALDKRWTSAPATSDVAASDPLGFACPPHETHDDLTPPEAGDAPTLPSPGSQPVGDPAPQLRRPCIAVVSAPRGSGRLNPWSSDPFPPPW